MRLDSVSVESVLKRGFAWVKDTRQRTIYNTENARRSLDLEVIFTDGSVKTKVIVRKDELQGDLFD